MHEYNESFWGKRITVDKYENFVENKKLNTFGKQKYGNTVGK